METEWFNEFPNIRKMKHQLRKLTGMRNVG